MNASWSQSGYAEIARLVRERTGLTFGGPRIAEVEGTIRRTMTQRGIGRLDDLAEQLRDDERLRESFIADLTIGESYFGRDPAQFELLRERILPDLLESRPDDRPVRVWSAGCSAGEEPYTVAILFEEMGAAGRSDIVGTDIARHRLEDAQRGIYSAWQLRSTPESERRRWFNPHGRYFELTPRIRRRVDFRYLNLAEDSFPSLATGIWGMDVILCRNVLIYFDPPTVERVARRLLASLSDDGWLILGASDPQIGDIVDCTVVLTDAGLAYRRHGVGGPRDIRTGAHATPLPEEAPAVERVEEPEVIDVAPVEDLTASIEAVELLPPPLELESAPHEAASTDPEAEIVEAYRRRDFAHVQQLAEAQGSALSAAGWVVMVRALANEGRLNEAAAALSRALDVRGAHPELLYLHSVLLLQTGRAADAAAAARRALYMDRTLVVAHLTLAEGLRRTGNTDGARRALRNAAALLTGIPPETVVPASDGETAGRLAELVRVKLRLLGNGE